MTEVAFIGLGVMGYPMAGHLQAKGYDVTVYNRSAAKAEKWVGEHGGASVLVGNDSDRIKEEYQNTLSLDRTPLRPDLWDGNTAMRCVKALINR